MVHELDGTKNEWGWCKQKVILNIGVDDGVVAWKAASILVC
jgi:hypothetical protein